MRGSWILHDGPPSIFSCFNLCSGYGKRTVADLKVVGLRFPKHTIKLPSWVLDLEGLQVLDLSHCICLETLPLEQLWKLISLELKGCIQLWSPPQEVCNQGGEATIRFLNDIKINGVQSESMALFLVGDGEAGKTSLIRAVTGPAGCAAKIRSDHRTVGIDVLRWDPGWGSIFTIYDLAGQAVYAKTNQIFVLRRALYVLVWRVIPTRSSDDPSKSLQNILQTVGYWLHLLQNRLPGSYILLVVTHIDEVDSTTLKNQREKVQEYVIDQLEK